MSASSRTIDLNADLGEGFPNDEQILAHVTSASISCGAHAGDRETILATLRAAKDRGVVVGAHPGFADREGFGRRERPVTAGDVRDLVLTQFRSLAGYASEVGLVLRFVKPHGALYNQAQRELPAADGVVAAVAQLGLPVLGQPRSVLESRAAAAGVRFIAEGFPDRRYLDDGRLMPRSQPGAILERLDQLEPQVLRLLEQGVATLCIHGDDPRAVTNATNVRALLEWHAIDVESFA